MRFFILSVFLLSLFLSVVHGQYAGVFLNTASKAKAATYKATTSPYPALNAVDKSFTKQEAHHMTIEFKPNPATKFSDFDNNEYPLKVLAYVHDSHGQALLVALENNPCKDLEGIEIANAWPHVTISHEAVSPYNAVYSNDLIARAIFQKIIRVKQTDSYGKPTTVGLYDDKHKTETEWWGISGNYTAPPTPTTPERTYAETPIYVKIFPQRGANVVRLIGTECYNTRWNDTTTACTLLN